MGRLAIVSVLFLVACATSRPAEVLCGMGTHLEGMSCIADTPGLVCGDDTLEQDGRCVARLSCGPGTTQEGMRCVALGDETVCGEGTVLTDGICNVSCGEGTVLVEGVCSAACGEGTVLLEGVCSPACDEGMMLVGGMCVPSGTGTTELWYTVRIASTMIPADGLSSVPLIAIGGVGTAPVTEQVLLTLSRASAGTIEDTAPTLGPFGVQTVFRPCSSAADPRCAGTAYISMALASDPSVEVARTEEFELLAPTGVGSVAACELQERALYFDGEGYIFTGTQLITGTNADFALTSLRDGGGVTIRVDPDDPALGRWWGADFAAPDSFQLEEQVYPIATRFPFNTDAEAGISVSGDGRGCNRNSGSFEVHRLERDPSTGEPTSVLISFEQFCEGSMNNVLRGCVKYSL